MLKKQQPKKKPAPGKKPKAKAPPRDPNQAAHALVEMLAGKY